MSNQQTVDPRVVFVVHGRNIRVKDDLFLFLLSIGLNPIEWSEAVRATGKGAPFIGEILDTAFSKPQAVIVLMTPDDEARLHISYQRPNDPLYEKQLTPQPRPNVLFEAGMAMALFPQQTILVEIGTIRPFSDISGRHIVRLNNSVANRQELARRLKDVGCDVTDLTAKSQWHTVGDFSIDEAVASPENILFANLVKRWKVRPGELIGDAGQRAENESWAIQVDQAEGKGIYGPYTQLQPNDYRATFRLKIDTISVTDERLATIDVTSRGAHKYFALRTLYSRDFIRLNDYQDFHLDFDLSDTERDMEFRVRTDMKYPARCLLTLDYVDVKTR